MQVATSKRESQRNQAAIHSGVRHGPALLATAFGAVCLVGYRFAADETAVDAGWVAGQEILRLFVAAPSLLGVMIVADAYFAWAVHPWRAEFRRRGTLSMLAIGTLFLLALGSGDLPEPALKAPWTLERGMALGFFAALACAPVGLCWTAYRLTRIARERWRRR